MEQKNGVQQTLMQELCRYHGVQETLRANGIMFKIDEHQNGLPEIISEETFMDILTMQDDTLPTSIDDDEYENDDLDDDGLLLG